MLVMIVDPAWFSLSPACRNRRQSKCTILVLKGDSMNEVILGIGVAAFVVYAAFNIVNLMSMNKTNDSVSAFLKNTESNVNTALVELKSTLEKLRKISGDIGVVTEDVKQISDLHSERGKEHMGLV
jgi:hypothetical protein